MFSLERTLMEHKNIDAPSQDEADKSRTSSSDSQDDDDDEENTDMVKIEKNFQRPSKVLREEDVIKIFTAGKPRKGTSTMKVWERGQIVKLSKEFKVTPKTIRDIWNRRTWKDLTASLISTTHPYPDAESFVSIFVCLSELNNYAFECSCVSFLVVLSVVLKL